MLFQVYIFLWLFKSKCECYNNISMKSVYTFLIVVENEFKIILILVISEK